MEEGDRNSSDPPSALPGGKIRGQLSIKDPPFDVVDGAQQFDQTACVAGCGNEHRGKDRGEPRQRATVVHIGCLQDPMEKSLQRATALAAHNKMALLTQRLG